MIVTDVTSRARVERLLTLFSPILSYTRGNNGNNARNGAHWRTHRAYARLCRIGAIGAHWRALAQTPQPAIHATCTTAPSR